METGCYCVARAGLELIILPSQTSECWDYRCVPLNPALLRMFNIPSIARFSVHCFSGGFCQEVETGESPPACELMVNAACCRLSPGGITL